MTPGDWRSMTQPDTHPSSSSSEPPRILLNFVRLLGWICLATALAFNEWTVEHTISSDGVLEGNARLAVWLVDTVLALTGVWLVRCPGHLAGMLRRYPNTSLTLAGAAAAIGLILAVELLFVGLNLTKPKPDWSVAYRSVYHEYDPLLGYRPPADAVMDVAIVQRGETLQEVAHTFDQYRRRTFADPYPGAGRDKCILMFGCSFAFGSHVPDDEVAAARLAAMAPDYAVYNYAYGGYGAGQMLAHLERPELTLEVPQHEAIGVYVFIPNHVRRTLGSMQTVRRWAKYFPYYKVEPDGSVEHVGSIAEARPLAVWFWELLSKEAVFSYYETEWPLYVSDRDLWRFAQIVRASRDTFEERFKSDGFYVVYWPERGDKEFHSNRLTPFLEKEGIAVLDYTDMPFAEDPKWWVPLDGHPSAAAHEAVAQRLGKDLGIVRR